MDNYLRLVSALNDPTRIMILKFLQYYGRSCVCELQHSFDMGQPRLSRHLKILKDAGLLAARRVGTKVFYSIAPVTAQGEQLLQTLELVEVRLPRKINHREIRQQKEAA
ncbi:ArsR/SmtB family transcription factor [Desulfolithobacter dissulfuricans]|nr:metalloregulator ArsR/SmtB family transcription factor [Desulfolithobacter dissulfuricans]